MKKLSLTICLLCSMILSSYGQILDYNNKVQFQLSDGTEVTCYGRAVPLSDEKTDEYYYLPTGLKLSQSANSSKPEFLFLKYTTEASEANGGISGGLIHALMNWGLTSAQMAQAKEKIKEVAGPDAELKGAADAFPMGDESFRIVSATVNKDGGRARSLVVSGAAPNVPGQKVAFASNMDAYGAQLLDASFKNNTTISDLSVTMDMGVKVMFPAVKGRVEINWTKLFEKGREIDESSSTSTKVTKGNEKYLFFFKKKNTKTDVSYSKMDSAYQQMIEDKIITFYLDDYLGTEETKKIKDMFFQIFTTMVTSVENNPDYNLKTDEDNGWNNESELLNQQMDQTKGMKMRWWQFWRGGNENVVTINKRFIDNKSMSSTQVIDLSNYRVPIVIPVSLTENMKSYYSSINNDQCLATLNLNDPFYNHQKIRFILDNNTTEMLQNGSLTYATVSIKKNRNQGNPFQKQLTIDKNYLKDNGNYLEVEYSSAGDQNPEIYQYATEYNLNGGYQYPATPVFKQGQMSGVALNAPVMKKRIEFEGDFADFKEKNIKRAVLVVRYKKFGAEVEEQISIAPNINEGAEVNYKDIYIDNNTQGYAYSIVFYNKGDRIATPWSEKVNDYYVYASIPKNMNNPNSPEYTSLIEASKAILKALSGDANVVNIGNTVLDGFKNIFVSN